MGSAAPPAPAAGPPAKARIPKKPLPKDLRPIDTVDWPPIENIAATILEVSSVTAHVPLEDIHDYIHGVNPSTTKWSELAPAVMDFYSVRIRALVPFEE